MIFLITLSLAILMGILFPYSALSLMPYGFVFFFVLMLLAGLSLQGRKYSDFTSRLPILLLGLFLNLVFTPLIQLTLARFFITDSHYLAGIYFGALAPVAIVAPFFTRLVDGDEELSHLLMIASSALFPFAAVLMLRLVPLPNMQFDLLPLAKGMLLLVLLPVLMSIVLNAAIPTLRRRIERALPALNSFCLAALIFILFGSATGRMNFSYSSGMELTYLLLLGFFQDFGTLALLLWLAPKFFDRPSAVALAISLSMKNTAIAATLLLFYSPNAAVPPTLIFIPHALLFALIPRFGTRKRNS